MAETETVARKTSLLSSFAEKGCQLRKSALGLPRWLSGKESDYNTGDTGSIPGLGRSPAEGNGNPLQYSWMKNTMDREAWRATYSSQGRKESNTAKHTYSQK